MKFTDYSFSDEIQKGIEEAGFTDCTPVQEKTFNFIEEGKDVYAQSQTGTGKTAAFLISIFHLLGKDEFNGRKALIVVPTRELAVQINEEADILGKYLDYKTGSFYGGTGYRQQEELLEKGLDIVVGTPGRLLDFVKQGKIKYEDFSFLVVDEADRMFDMGFVDDLRRILKGIQKVENKRTFLFSATMNSKVGNIAWEFMTDPGEIYIEPEQVTVEAITQELYHVSKDEKLKLLLGLLKRDNPESAVFFTNTKSMAYQLSKRLEVNGYPSQCLMGDVPQKKRLKIVNDLKAGKTKYLVATDVAARGLHVDNLELVVNYDLPIDSENYVHRIGRTARAGNSGKAISLACESFVYGLGDIEKYIEMKIPVVFAEEDLYTEDASAGMSFHREDSRRGGRSGDRKRGGERGHGGERGRSGDRNRTGDRSRTGERNRNRSGEGRGDNRRSGSPGKGSGRRRGGERDLENLKRVRSQVMSVTGSMAFDEEFTKKPKSGKQNKKRKDRYKEPRETDKNLQPKGDGKKKKYSKKDDRIKTGDGKKHPKKSRKGGNKPQNLKRVSSDAKIDDRLEYYKKKYGDDFKVISEKITPKKPAAKKGLFGKIKSIFK